MRIFAFAFVSLSLASCSALAPLAPPEVTLVDLEVSKVELFETAAVVALRLSNENPEPLTVEGGVFKIYLNGTRVGRAMGSETIEVPRLGSTVQRFDLSVSNLALATRLIEMIESPVLEYRIKSKLYVVRPYGTRRMSSVHEGRLDLDARRRGPAERPAPPDEPPPGGSPVE